MTKAAHFVYHYYPNMNKKLLERSFPVALAVFSFVFYHVLYRPQWHSPEMVASLLLFFTALAWGALIFLSLERRHWLRFLYAAFAAVLSIFLVEVLRFFPESLGSQRLLYGCNLLGILLIEFYLNVLKKEQRESL